MLSTRPNTSSGLASFTLHLTSLDLSSGAVVQSTGVPSSISTDAVRRAVFSRIAVVVFLSQWKGETPVVLWLSASSLFYLLLSSAAHSLKPMPRSLKAKLEGTCASLEDIIDVRLSALGHAVVSRNDGSAFVVKVSGEGEGDGDGDNVGVESVWEFEGSVRTLSLCFEMVILMRSYLFLFPSSLPRTHARTPLIINATSHPNPQNHGTIGILPYTSRLDIRRWDGRAPEVLSNLC
ncbi:hypothetical protein CVT25_008556 [Psilocybe cyanescens]|uniref:Uncharacterized protein n=1 Tax=Psilocybe cyanescens TaxID=93625 RepID=A0A409WAC6_PSICY|nr:hypothetical protein CVT25_008556 [Psilocybe cyanescens]